MRSLEMDGNYLGYCYLNGDFKFRSHETTWDAPDWGMGSAEGSLVEEGEKNIPAVAAGFYRVEASLADGTYNYSPIMIGIIGSATPNGWDSDVNMTYDKAEEGLDMDGQSGCRRIEIPRQRRLGYLLGWCQRRRFQLQQPDGI